MSGGGDLNIIHRDGSGFVVTLAVTLDSVEERQTLSSLHSALQRALLPDEGLISFVRGGNTNTEKEALQT